MEPYPKYTDEMYKKLPDGKTKVWHLKLPNGNWFDILRYGHPHTFEGEEYQTKLCRLINREYQPTFWRLINKGNIYRLFPKTVMGLMGLTGLIGAKLGCDKLKHRYDYWYSEGLADGKKYITEGKVDPSVVSQYIQLIEYIEHNKRSKEAQIKEQKMKDRLQKQLNEIIKNTQN